MNYCCPKCGERPATEFERIGEKANSLSDQWDRWLVTVEPFTQSAVQNLNIASQQTLVRHIADECQTIFAI